MVYLASARVGIALAILVVAATQSAAADEVVSIRGGTFVFEANAGNLDISGNKAFRLEAQPSISGGVFEAYSQCQTPSCPPGTVVDLQAFWSGSDLGGRARLRGVTYEGVGGLDSDSSAAIGFSSGPITMPPLSDGPVTLIVPFEFSGSFSYGLNGPEPQRVLLAGGGLATVLLRPHDDGGSWVIQRVTFDFRPVEQR